MRLRSQPPTTTSSASSAPQPLSVRQSSASTPTSVVNVRQQKPQKRSRNYLPALRIILLVSALLVTALEVVSYIDKVVVGVLNSGYFIQSLYFPQAAVYSPSGNSLVVCVPAVESIDGNSSAKTVKGSIVDLYDSKTGKKIKSIYNGRIVFNEVSFSRDQEALYLHSRSEGIVEIYDLKADKLSPIIGDSGSMASRLNRSDNSLIAVYEGGVSVQKLDDFSTLNIDIPKNRNSFDKSVGDLNFSPDSRFISWVAYSQNYAKKILRLADMKKGKIIDLETANGADISSEAKFLDPIVVSPDGRYVYLTGNVHKASGSDEFSYGIAEVDLQTGKVTKSQSQSFGIKASHVSGKSLFVKNDVGETALLTHWDSPVDTLRSVPNAIALSPDKRWYLTYERYGLKRYPVKK